MTTADLIKGLKDDADDLATDPPHVRYAVSMREAADRIEAILKAWDALTAYERVKLPSLNAAILGTPDLTALAEYEPHAPNDRSRQ